MNDYGLLVDSFQNYSNCKKWSHEELAQECNLDLTYLEAVEKSKSETDDSLRIIIS